MFSLVSEWACKTGIWLLHCLDDWLVVVELVPLLLRHEEQLLQFCWDLGIVINWEKQNLEPTSRAQYLGMLKKHHPREGLLLDCQILGSLPTNSFSFHQYLQRCGSSCLALRHLWSTLFLGAGLGCLLCSSG